MSTPTGLLLETLVPEGAREALGVIHGVGGDDLVLSLLRTFLDYADKQLASVAIAVGAGDAAAIARLAHAVKSSARQLGAGALADACERAEHAGQCGDLPVAIAGTQDMVVEFSAVREWMEAVLQG
jgi:HPt (histidine-containing phosphotransfer) domain-containing protein